MLERENVRMCMHAKSLQSCLPLYDLTDFSLPGSSVHRILQGRILEWVAVPSSRGSSQPRDGTHTCVCMCMHVCVYIQTYFNKIWVILYIEDISTYRNMQSYLTVFMAMCQGPAPVDPGNSKGRRRRRGKLIYLII